MSSRFSLGRTARAKARFEPLRRTISAEVALVKSTASLGGWPVLVNFPEMMTKGIVDECRPPHDVLFGNDSPVARIGTVRAVVPESPVGGLGKLDGSCPLGGVTDIAIGLLH